MNFNRTDLRLNFNTPSKAGSAAWTQALSIMGAVAFAVLVGQVVDKTTGQPLTGVEVRAEGSGKAATAHTDEAGKYALRTIATGHYTITLSSDDVPPQTFTVDVHGTKPQRFNMIACSTTLDYSCASAMP